MSETVSGILQELYEEAYVDGLINEGKAVMGELIDKYKERIKQALKESFRDAHSEEVWECGDEFEDWFEKLTIK